MFRFDPIRASDLKHKQFGNRHFPLYIELRITELILTKLSPPSFCSEEVHANVEGWVGEVIAGDTNTTHAVTVETARR